MRWILPCLLTFVVPISASAEDAAGEQFIVVAPVQAELKIKGQRVGVVPRGQAVVAAQTQGEWLWVEHDGVKGWIQRRDVVTPKEVLLHIRPPGAASAEDFMRDGANWLQRKAPLTARWHFDTALELNPRLRGVHVLRGLTHLQEKSYAAALSDMNVAVEADPQDPIAPLVRGKLLRQAGRYQEALADIDRAIELNPQAANAHIQRALLLAASPADEVRDGKLAVTSATKACELTRWKEPRALASLSIALAETGSFPEAAERAREAMAMSSRDDAVREMIQGLIDDFTESRPHREAANEDLIAALNPAPDSE